MSNTENYPNRSDLRNPANKVAKMTAKGQTYGKASQQLAAQEAVPMAAPPTTPSPARVAPGGLGDFTRPTERPEEPATFGSMVGPGPGPEVLGIRPSVPATGSKRDLVERVRAIADVFPSPVLLAFLSELEQS